MNLWLLNRHSESYKKSIRSNGSKCIFKPKNHVVIGHKIQPQTPAEKQFIVIGILLFSREFIGTITRICKCIQIERILEPFELVVLLSGFHLLQAWLYQLIFEVATEKVHLVAFQGI